MSEEEHSDRNTVKLEADRFQDDVRHAWISHSDTETDSLVLHVSNSLNEVKKDDEDSEEEDGTASERENDEISRKDAEIRRLIELRRSTSNEEHERVKELSKSIQKYVRDKKRWKRQQEIQKKIKDFKCVNSMSGIKSVKKKVLITKIKNERLDIIITRKWIVNVFEEFYEKLYDDNE